MLQGAAGHGTGTWSPATHRARSSWAVCHRRKQPPGARGCGRQDLPHGQMEWRRGGQGLSFPAGKARVRRHALFSREAREPTGAGRVLHSLIEKMGESGARIRVLEKTKSKGEAQSDTWEGLREDL